MHRDSEKIVANLAALHQSGNPMTEWTPAPAHARGVENGRASAAMKTRRCETVMLQ